jgi:hypothetical protein
MFFEEYYCMKSLKKIALLFFLGLWTAGLQGNTSFDYTVKDPEVIIFPNPATEETISIESEKTIAHVEILNVVGQKILYHEPEPSNSLKIDISMLNTGLYLIKISFDDNTNITKRIWVK